MPRTVNQLIGRDRELETLDAAWKDSNTRVISVVAWGGVGKTALIKHWRDRMSLDRFRGARAVLDWSFYSQGTSNKAASADQFIDSALQFFGEEKLEEIKSPWDRGARLAELVARQPVLLILDGLEPLQYPPGPMAGELKDPALKTLLEGLAGWNPGLCIITTREEVAELKPHEGLTCSRIGLERLTDEAGAQLLKDLGVRGETEELVETTSDLSGHALSLTLLGR